MKATQLDALAIAIGTSHGAYKFSRKPTGETLSIQRVKEIEDIAGATLVSEGIDANYMDIINYAVFGAIKLA